MATIPQVLAVYGVMFIILGIILLICVGGNTKPDGELALRKARAKRARIQGHIVYRVQVDNRVRRHAAVGERYYQ
jgi:hypothetical protein